ncbi:MAG TPA: hypothetical protein VGR27_15885, partial [Longimicrobiaceae bacterium]|nr:hypothetical protein [Longimicrobiaceae bacterium]
MNVDISVAWAQIQAMLNGFIALLPNIVLALVVFATFFVIAKTVRRLVRRFAESRDRHRNLELVLGRLAQWLVIFLGLLVATAIVFPTFSPGDLITLLGVGGVAIGFAFK